MNEKAEKGRKRGRERTVFECVVCVREREKGREEWVEWNSTIQWRGALGWGLPLRLPDLEFGIRGI